MRLGILQREMMKELYKDGRCYLRRERELLLPRLRSGQVQLQEK